MSNISGLHTAATGLKTAQTRMDTAAHNISNVGTDGYTRQRVETAALSPQQTVNGPVGRGVEVTDIGRLRDAFLDERVRTTGAGAEQATAHADVLERAERVMGEPDDGITEAMATLWDAFEDLANDPSEPATREQVLGALDDVARRFNTADRDLDALAEDVTRQIREHVDEVNGLTAQIAEVNEQIDQTGAGRAYPDLADRRDHLVDELSELIGARVADTDDGSHRVTVGGLTLVEGSRVNALEAEEDGSIEHQASGQEVPAGGRLGGLQAALGHEDDEGYASLHALRNGLDGLADEVADQLNGQHEQGYTVGDGESDPSQGDDLLQGAGADADNGGAAGLAVAEGLQPSDIAAAKGEEGGPQDGRNAQALADLRDAPFTTDNGEENSEESESGGETIDRQLRELVGGLASSVSGQRRTADNQASQAAIADEARRGEHGVSIDEEMVDLMTHQRAFEAASRVTSTIDEALDVLINRTGVVGR